VAREFTGVLQKALSFRTYLGIHLSASAGINGLSAACTMRGSQRQLISERALFARAVTVTTAESGAAGRLRVTDVVVVHECIVR